MKNNKVSLVTGGFDPVHSGHIEYFKKSKEISGSLVIGLNSDEWLIRKKGFAFMPWDERKNILINMSVVDEVIAFNDEDNTACDAIAKTLNKYEHVIFTNGGDREKNNIPEIEKYEDHTNVEFIFGVGGSNKMNSSSSITEKFIQNHNQLNDYSINEIKAPWGKHDTIVDHPKYKLKQLFVNPGSMLSLQYHHHRSEHWVVASGIAHVQLGDQEFDLKEGEYIHIPQGEKHRISNNTNSDLVIVEVQYGDILEESDIVRLEDSFGRS